MYYKSITINLFLSMLSTNMHKDINYSKDINPLTAVLFIWCQLLNALGRIINRPTAVKGLDFMKMMKSQYFCIFMYI